MSAVCVCIYVCVCLCRKLTLTAVTPSELLLSTVTSQYVFKDTYFADHIQTLLL